MKNLIPAIVSILIASSVSAAPGDVTVLHQALNPHALSFDARDIKYFRIGGQLTYNTLDYNFDISSLSSKVLEAKRSGHVVDVLKIESKVGDDVISVISRPATAAERDNAITVLADRVLVLETENAKLKTALSAAQSKR